MTMYMLTRVYSPQRVNAVVAETLAAPWPCLCCRYIATTSTNAFHIGRQDDPVSRSVTVKYAITTT